MGIGGVAGAESNEKIEGTGDASSTLGKKEVKEKEVREKSVREKGDKKTRDKKSKDRRWWMRRGGKRARRLKRRMREMQNEGAITVSSASSEVVAEVVAKKPRVYKPSDEEKKRWLRADDRLKPERMREQINGILRAEARKTGLEMQS